MVTLNTLNSLIDDIMLTIRNSNIVESENINKLQVKQWIDTYRALLLKQDIDKDGDINPEYIQYLDNVNMEVTSINEGSSVCKMVSTIKLPKTLDLNHRYGILYVTDRNGNDIQIGTETKAIRQKSRRFTCNDYIAYFKGGYINIIGPNLIETVSIGGVFEDPDAVDDLNGDCKDGDKPYPLPYDKIPTLRELIEQRELGLSISMPTDDINNAKNDTLNAGTTRA